MKDNYMIENRQQAPIPSKEGFNSEKFAKIQFLDGSFSK